MCFDSPRSLLIHHCRASAAQSRVQPVTMSPPLCRTKETVSKKHLPTWEHDLCIRIYWTRSRLPLSSRQLVVWNKKFLFALKRNSLRLHLDTLFVSIPIYIFILYTESIMWYYFYLIIQAIMAKIRVETKINNIEYIIFVPYLRLI